MAVGIIVHSFSGNTLSVAEKLQKELNRVGVVSVIERVTVKNEDPSSNEKAVLENAPDISAFDKIIFACPVRGFTATPAMKLYLSGVSSLKDKKIGVFATQYLPFPFLGGIQAINNMNKYINTKGGKATVLGVINWNSKKREVQTEKLITDLVNLVN